MIMTDLNVAIVNEHLSVKEFPKGSTIVLQGAAVAASVAEADATVIDMRQFTGGSLDVKVNSGTGTYSCALMASEAGTGVFHQIFKGKDDGTYVTHPPIVTTSTVSAAYQIKDIKANYIKIVPTLTGTCNATFSFTPSN